MGLGCPVTKKWEYDGDTQIYKTYYKSGEIKNETITFDATSDELLNIYQSMGIKWGLKCDLDYDYLGYGKWLKWTKEEKKDWHTNLRNYKKINRMSGVKEEIYTQSGHLWHEHFFNDLIDVDLFIPTYYDTIFDYEPFVEYFRTCRNVIPYKSDLIDVNISRLQLMQKDLEKVNKEDLFYHLDHYIICNRMVESKLKKHKIPYEYFDLDNEDYDKWIDDLLPRIDGYGWGAYPFDKTTKRYAIARQISKDYISSRGLTDLRLIGKINDRI